MADTKVSKFLHVGPGGMNCTCCFPAPGKIRQKLFRNAKRKSKLEAVKIIKEEI